jgi:hypothetical protein
LSGPNKRHGKLRLAVAVLCNLAAFGLFRLANDRFLLSGGSDAPNVIWAPSMTSQVFCLLLMIAVSAGALVLRRSLAMVAGLLWAGYLLSGSHRLVWDVVSSEVRDTYAMIPVQSMAVGDTEGGIERYIAARPLG